MLGSSLKLFAVFSYSVSCTEVNLGRDCVKPIPVLVAISTIRGDLFELPPLIELLAPVLILYEF